MSTVNLALLSLFPATAAQTIESRKRSHIEWGRWLSMEDFLRRDEILEKLEHANGDKLTTWVLAPRDDPETLDFFCACESYRRESAVAHPSDSTPKPAIAYGIASVFTPPHHRRRGYAQHMMRLLHWVLAHPVYRTRQTFPKAWGTAPTVPAHVGDAQWSALYSDIGPKFYASTGMDEVRSNGWEVRGAENTIWNIEAKAEAGSDEHWELMDLPAAERMWSEDANLMSQNLVQLANASGKIAFSFLPDKGISAMQVHRTINMADGTLPSNVWGIRLRTDVSSEEPVYATWTLEQSKSGHKVLILTRLRVSDDNFESLLQKLEWAAREAGACKIEVWNLPSSLKVKAEQLGGKTEVREAHLPSIKWYGGEDAEWMFNERFSWC